jgi:hypothetical protein
MKSPYRYDITSTKKKSNNNNNELLTTDATNTNNTSTIKSTTTTTNNNNNTIKSKRGKPSKNKIENKIENKTIAGDDVVYIGSDNNALTREQLEDKIYKELNP